MNCKHKGCEEKVYCCKLCKTHYKQEMKGNSAMWIETKPKLTLHSTKIKQ